MSGRDLLADRRLHWIAGGIASIILILLVVVAMFPWGMLKPRIERHLSREVGGPVTIVRIERLDSFSFTPTIAIRGVHIPQPKWAGRGDLAQIATARVRFGAFGALFGHFSPQSIDVSGLRAALVRDADRRENWRLGGKGGSGALSLDHLTVSDGQVSYRDAVQHRQFDVAIAADTHGLRINGKGAIQGNPVAIAAHGPAVSASGAWPFTALITGDAVGMQIRGTMDRPLDTGHMTLDLATHASDLKLVDALIEAGLFGTQPVKFAGHARHDGTTWTITGLHGTIGRSDIAGHVTVKKVDGRTKLDGAMTSNSLDFDDLASNAGKAKAAALRRSIGDRLVPNTRINLAKIGDTDGTITVDAKHLVSRTGPSALASLSGTITLDHRKLVISPLRIGLTRGEITGTVTVDQHDGGAVPKVTIALDLTNGSITTLAGGGGEVTGSVAGRVRMVGHGSTIREAVGDGDGHIGLVARDGALPAKIASLLGFDVARGLTTDSDERAGLRCAVIALDLKGGAGRLDPMVIDTTRAQSNGQGTITFPSEALAIRLTGAPKAKSVLRLPGAIIVSGSIKQPDVATQKGTKSIGNVFKAIGQSISGNQAPRAIDADCAALEAKALR